MLDLLEPEFQVVGSQEPNTGPLEESSFHVNSLFYVTVYIDLGSYPSFLKHIFTIILDEWVLREISNL